MTPALRSAPAGFILAGLLVVTFAVYAPAIRSQFVSDDLLAITGNELVSERLAPIEIFTRFSWWGAARADAPGYRPLVTLSFAVDQALAGLNPSYFHCVNLAWHALVSWLVFALGVRIGLDGRQALLAAIAFCLLPIHSEAVIWAVGRAELMAAAGFSAALCLLLDHRSRPSLVKLAAAAAAFTAALFSKENAVTLLAAPVLAACVLPGSDAKRRRDLVTLGVLLVALTAYVATRAAAGPLLGSAAGDRLDNPLSVLSLGSRLLGSVSVLGRYFALLVWPHPLSVDYSYDALAIDAGFSGDRYVVIALIACGALGVAAWRSRRQTPGIAFALLLAAATYSIASNVVFVVGTAMAERLFYLPTVGLCLAAGPMLARVADTARGRGRFALIVLGVAWALVIAGRAREWSTPVTLFEATAKAYPRSARAQMELATAYGQAGRTVDAETAFQRATEIMPAYAAAWYNLGNLYARRSRGAEAEKAYGAALIHAPRLAAARHNLALLLLAAGRPQEAAGVLEDGLQWAAGDPGFLMLLGDSYLALARDREAAETYERVIAIEPAAHGARLNRGVAMQRSSGCEAALPDYLAVVEQAPSSTALNNAIACLHTVGREEEARALLLRARVANREGGR